MSRVYVSSQLLGRSEDISMTWMKFITSPEYGCCTTAELIAASKYDPTLKNALKDWAIAEMKNRGIEVTES